MTMTQNRLSAKVIKDGAMRQGISSSQRTSIVGSGLAVTRFRPAPLADTSLDRRDLLHIGILLLLWFCLLVLRNTSLPLIPWDEARLANSALEMVRSRHWLVPTYGGIPDHWFFKPPLLIWQMAVLMWLGLPPLLAVRLPTMLAAWAIVGTMWAVCRYALHDRTAALLAGLLLLPALFFNNIHIARTGDYDVPVSLFTLLYVLTCWWSIEQDDKIRTGWFAISAAALLLAVMTKGVAGAFGLVGLFVFSLVRGRLVALLGSFRIWLLALAAFSLCFGYYGSRELYDPGYLQGVWNYELFGRFFIVNEEHVGGPLFYINILFWGFEPCIILLPLVTLTIFGTDFRRRSLASLCLLCAAAILVVLTISRTKIYWYITPVLPFLALAAALGAADGLRWIKSREPSLPKLSRARPLQVVLGLLLAAVCAASIYRNQVMKLRDAEQDPYWSQLWYGKLFDKLQARGDSSVFVLDGGYWGLGNYNPVLKFYADIAREKGLQVKIPAFDLFSLGADVPDDYEKMKNYNPYSKITQLNYVQEISPPLPKGELVATCDFKLIPWLKRQHGFATDGEVRSCIFGVIR
jgi:4-amino-4-deoxy-L-arabinose transferase-like glycosyltransferase